MHVRPEPPPLSDEHAPLSANGADILELRDRERRAREDVPRSLTTDTANAERLVRQSGRDLRYCRAWGTWLAWDGKRWARDATGAAERAAKATVRRIAHEAMGLDGTEGEKAELFKWAIRSEAKERRIALLTLAQSEPAVAVTHDELDSQPDALNCLNGTLDLRTGELLDHDRSDLITRLAPVRYDPDALCPTWEAFLLRVLPGEGLRRFARALAGYCLTGDVSAEVCFFLIGKGSNGKSTFVQALQSVLGDYARPVPEEVIMSRGDEGGATPERAMLRGLRLAIVAETEEGRSMSSAALKKVTSTDTISARGLYESPTEFAPTHKLILCTNHRPRIRSADDGTWRRVFLIPFNVQIPDSEKDYRLKAKLWAEREGILAWMVRGALDWRASGGGKVGLCAPAIVTAATADYRESEDTLAPFLAEHCILEPDVSVTRGELRKAYVAHAEGAKERPMSAQALCARLLELDGVTDGRAGGGRAWRGIRLRAMFDAAPKD